MRPRCSPPLRLARRAAPRAAAAQRRARRRTARCPRSRRALRPPSRQRPAARDREERGGAPARSGAGARPRLPWRQNTRRRFFRQDAFSQGVGRRARGTARRAPLWSKKTYLERAHRQPPSHRAAKVSSRSLRAAGRSGRSGKSQASEMKPRAMANSLSGTRAQCKRAARPS